MLPRILPFAVYMAFIPLVWLWQALSSWMPVSWAWTDVGALWVYPVKIALVTGCLVYFRSAYQELRTWPIFNMKDGIFAVGVGLLVYLAWVRMDWTWATQGNPGGYDPFLAGREAGIFLVVMRLFGAVVVVAFMEELFWRSFIMRYIISSKFETVPLGKFTFPSFLITAILFGVEHHLWLAGMMAGLAYNYLLCRTGRLWVCVIAHAVTNLALGIHVLMMAEWHWW